MKDTVKETASTVSDTVKGVTAAAGVRHLGDYIRDQRAGSGVSLRQLAKTAGVSNPYLSQIERGLRKPSAEILQQIAKALRISAEALYVQAGFLEQRVGSAVVDAVLADEGLTERQKQVLLEIYDSFRREDAPAGADVLVSVVTAPTDGAAEPATPTPRAPAAKAPGAKRSSAAARTAAKTAGRKPAAKKPGRKPAGARPAPAPDAAAVVDPTA